MIALALVSLGLATHLRGMPVLNDPARTTALLNEHPRVVIVTDAKAFVHDCIPTARTKVTAYLTARGLDTTPVAAASIDRLAADPQAKDAEATKIRKADVVIFLVTTGDVLNEKGKVWLQNFIHAGGGYVGVHSASDTLHGWDWYKHLVGAEFKTHPAIQEAHIVIEDRAHPTTSFLPDEWKRTDEWYEFTDNPRSHVRVLCSVDEKSYTGGTMGDHPITWCQEFEGGRSWYTAMGHNPTAYSEDLFMKGIYEAVIWAAQAKKPAKVIEPTWLDEKGWTRTPEGIEGHGKATNLVSKQTHGDAWVHAEFKIPKDSNSGVYLQGRYEIQVFDSYGKPAKELAFSDAGGIYERFLPGNKVADGTAPMANAIREPGQWNTYDILFRAPRFDSKGKKVENARVLEVRVNGVVVQHNVSLNGPTGGPIEDNEVPKGPLMLQGDHGPIVYRNVWIIPQKL